MVIPGYNVFQVGSLDGATLRQDIHYFWRQEDEMIARYFFSLPPLLLRKQLTDLSRNQMVYTDRIAKKSPDKRGHDTVSDEAFQICMIYWFRRKSMVLQGK